MPETPGSLPFSLCALLVAWLLARASRTLLSRRERAAADLLEDAKALLSRGEPDRLRSVLATDRTSFAEDLQAAIDRAPLAQPEVQRPKVPSALVPADIPYTLLCLTAVLLVFSTVIYTILDMAISAQWRWNPGTEAWSTLPLALAAGLALRAAFAIDRLRDAAIARMVTWIEEVSALAHRGTTPPSPPAGVS